MSITHRFTFNRPSIVALVQTAEELQSAAMRMADIDKNELALSLFEQAAEIYTEVCSCISVDADPERYRELQVKRRACDSAAETIRDDYMR